MPSDLTLRNKFASLLNALSYSEATRGLQELLQGVLGRLAGAVPGDSALLLVQVADELNELTDNASNRQKLHRLTIEACTRQVPKGDPVTVVALGRAVIDQFNDRACREDAAILRGNLARCRRLLENAISGAADPGAKALLLTQLAAIVRCQGSYTPVGRKYANVSKAVRSARLATQLAPESSFAHVELAQSLYSQARYTYSEESAYRLAAEAKQVFETAVGSGDPLAYAGKAIFERHSYRPAEAVATFIKFAELESRRRLVLRGSFVLAESAVQMWYNSYTDESRARALDLAEAMMAEAVDAGYRSARFLVDLAFVHAAQGRMSLAEGVMKRLAKSESTSWLEVMHQLAERLGTDDELRTLEAFAVGITDPSIWNGLGTFSRTFMNDLESAELFYRGGLKLAPNHPVLLTNLARLLAKSDGPSGRDEARVLLHRAATHSDKLFNWWRDVKELVQKKSSRSRRMRKKPDHLVTRPTLLTRFRKLQQGTLTGADRGRAFEALIAQLFALSVESASIGSHKVHDRQVDAAFKIEGAYYRVEAKWQASTLGPEEIGSLIDRMDTPGITGVLVSMSPYSESAVRRAEVKGASHVILLFGPTDVEALFDSIVQLEGLLEMKRDWFMVHGKPYVPFDILAGPTGGPWTPQA